MIRPRFVCLLLLLCLASPVRAITHITNPTLVASATWGPTGTVVDNEFWIEPSSGTTFTINAGATLTIQPGTTVRLNGGVSLIVNGALIASGSALSPMSFDVISPTFSEWGGISVGASATLGLNGCTIRAFGVNPVYGSLTQVASLYANNTFEPRADLMFNAIKIRGGTVASSVTLSHPPADFCYITDGNPIVVGAVGGPVLTIEDRTVIKFTPGDYLMTAQSNTGGLRAKGVVFTSSQDDTLGDANGNGPTVGAPGQWRNLRFELGTLPAQTIVDSCVIRFGGDTDDFGVVVRNANPTLTRCVIDRNRGIGLYVDGTSTGLGLTANLLRNNTTWELSSPAPPMVSLMPNNDVKLSLDDKYNGYHLQGTTIAASMTLPKPPAGFCYILNGNPIGVSAVGGPVLTIADRTVIKFTPGDYLMTAQSNTGGLQAKGVVFTSSQDDTLGDTNGNGPSVGAPGQWRNLRFELGTLPAQTIVDSCVIRFGGDTDDFGVVVRNANPTLTRCVIDRNRGIGLYVDGTSTGLGLTANLMRNNTTWELSSPAPPMVSLMPNNDVRLSLDGKYNGYHLQGTTIAASMTLPRPPAGFCYILNGNPIGVRAAGGPVLTIADRTVIKFTPGDYLMTAQSNTGGLRAKGVVFTSSQDDTLGDTNGNGPSVGAPGQWRNLRFELGTLAAQTIVDSCVIRFGGDTDDFGVVVRNANPTLTRCVIDRNRGIGIYVDGNSTGQAVSGNLLRGNTTWELSAPLAPMTHLVPTNVVMPSGELNGKYNGFHVQGGVAVGALALSTPPPGIAYYFTGSITIPAGSSLSIPGETVIKMGPGVALNVAGTLTTTGLTRQPPYDPIVVTSYRDDKWWGDTNGDGPTTGVAGDWQRVEITGGNNASVVDGAIFSFGGSGALGQLYVNGTGAQSAPNVLIKNSHFYLTSALTGVRTLNSNARLDSCSFFGGSPMFGVSNATPAITVIASNSWWGHFSGPFDPSVADPCTNPGGLGVGVSDFVNYCPFLSTGAPVTDAPPPVVGPTRTGIAWMGPVPARTAVSLMLGVPSDDEGTLEFLDPSGRVVRRLKVQASSGTGVLVRWDLSDERGGRVAPGVYFARYRHGQVSEVRRVVLTR